MVRKNLLSLIFIIMISMIISEKAYSQEGCCGFNVFSAGLSGSFGLNMYNPEGLNHLVNVYNQKRATTLTKKMGEFGNALGWKITLNFIRIQLEDNMELNLYMHFQNSTEEQSAENREFSAERTYKVGMTQWGFGMNTYMPITRKLYFKVLDAAVTINSATFSNKYVDNTTFSEEKLTSSETGYGVTLETGLRYYIFKPYIAVSVNAGYSYFTINEMKFDNGGRYLSVSETESRAMDNFITGGGVFANAQLTISVPF